MVNYIVNSQEIGIVHCNINTCHNTNINLIITILQKYSTGLHKFAGIETKFEIKFKLQTNKTEKQKKTIIVMGRYQNWLSRQGHVAQPAVHVASKAREG
jgi:tRNA U34 2-thiouridine synthase MnmA/TrmU